MGDKTGINWTDATWNPIVGCSILSPGCKFCYAMREAARLERMGVQKYAGLTRIVNNRPVFNGVVRVVPEALDQPRRWQRPRRIFVNSMSDIAHPALGQGDFNAVLIAMEEAPHHVYQVLTKRPGGLLERLTAFFQSDQAEPLFARIWWGVSVEDQRRADERREAAAAIAAQGFKVWVSYEPAIGPVDWDGWAFIAGMVSGGESGQDARPSHPNWHRDTRDWCAENGIPFDFKQWGEWAPGECAPGPQTRTERVAILSMDGWWFNEITPKIGAELHCDDGPDVWRFGKRSSGRMLDGQEHNGFTLACAPVVEG